MNFLFAATNPLVAALLLIGAVGLLAIFFALLKLRFFETLFIKLGLISPRATTNWTAISWESSLRQLGLEADVVFFGDSITRGGDFQRAFPQYSIVNLGSTGDTLWGMRRRIGMIKAVNPNKIFFLGGINGLTRFNLSKCAKQYEALVQELTSAFPNTEIYLQSVLPVVNRNKRHTCSNKTIHIFNEAIKSIAEANSLVYIDLNTLYLLDGQLNPDFTTDGLHLKPDAYDLWIKAIEQFLPNGK